MLPHMLRAAQSLPSYVGSVTKAVENGAGFDTPAEALDVLSIAGVGDLVVISITFASNSDNTFSWNGMTFTSPSSADNTGSNTPGSYVGYRFVQAGDTNPYVTGVGSGNWLALSIIASVFRNVRAFAGAATSSSSSGTPAAPLLIANASLWVATGHLDNDIVTTWSAPTNYTLAASRTAASVGGFINCSGVVAYRIQPLISDLPGAFTASASDAWRASTFAFA